MLHRWLLHLLLHYLLLRVAVVSRLCEHWLGSHLWLQEQLRLKELVLGRHLGCWAHLMTHLVQVVGDGGDVYELRSLLQLSIACGDLLLD